jgi:photosystem II stability/assembly factor-like uncharacterized protein
VHFVDSQHGWISGQYGVILHTDDGGKNWRERASFTEANLNKIYFVNTNVGIAVGDEGTMLITVDGGKRWIKHNSGVTEDLYDIYVSSDSLIAVGERGVVVKYTIPEVTIEIPQKPFVAEELLPSSAPIEILWTVVQQGDSNANFTDICFIDSEQGWIVGTNGTILHTDDGGITWSQQNSGTNKTLIGIHFIAPELGWMMAQDATLFSTSDGGETWVESRHLKPRQKSFDEEMNPIEVDYKLQAVHFAQSSEGWAVGDYGAILHNVDGGPIWTEQPINSTPDLRGVYFLAATSRQLESSGYQTRYGWMVGKWGTIWHTINGGRYWSHRPSNTCYDLEAVYFVDSQQGWAVGKYGVILYTSDGGENWNAQNSGVSKNLYGVCFRNPKEGWVVGEGGVILSTQDGGGDWTREGSGTESGLTDIEYVDGNGLWAIGKSGIILRQSNLNL